MSTPETASPSTSQSRASYLQLAVPFMVMTCFYLWYALVAWFHQDDFDLLDRYGSDLHFSDLWQFEDVGRFITRNLYWFLGSALFGEHAALYFLFNLGTLIATSAVIYLIVRPRFEGPVAAIATLFYFCLPALVPNYVWIANSQHLLAHFLALLFVLIYIRTREISWRPWIIVGLFSVFAVGVYSNIYVGFVISLPVLFMISDRQARLERGHWILVALGVCLFGAVILAIRRFQAGPYETRADVATVLLNAQFYFRHLWKFIGWLVICVAGVLLNLRRARPLEAWMLLASLLFFLPFALLRFQHYLSYAVMFQLCFLLGVFLTALQELPVRYQGTMQLLGVLMVAVLCIQSIPQMRQAIDSPWGSTEKQIVDQLIAFDRQQGRSVRHYCFNVEAAGHGTTGVAVWEIPPVWWHVGFGTAFKLFVDPGKTYQLVHDAHQCDVTLELGEGRVSPIR